MDLSETTKEVINRHPWELSRTRCTLETFSRYLDNESETAVYANVGAGDLYFDRALLKKYVNHRVYAIDIAYKDIESTNERISKHHFFEEISQESIDYAIMMDSLEYMEDDAAYVKKICGKIRSGGYFFFTLPAFPILFSDYDINIKNLRRYTRKSFASILKDIPELEIVEEYYFYTSLFFVRFIQKAFHISIDPHHKFTANWRYSESGWITKLLTACLNLDFLVNRMLSKIGILFPGLSMMAICRKKQENFLP